MPRKVFYSFHYKPDNWRVSQVKQAGVVEGQPILTSNEWEEVKRGGDDAIREWIDDQMKGKSCLVVLVGNSTAGRKWVKFEIKKAWEANKGVVGVYIHNLKDASQNQSTMGRNPFDDFNVDGTSLSSMVRVHNPPYSTSTYVYDHIKENLAGWVEDAVAIRASYG
jgi:hypothetical protein